MMVPGAFIYRQMKSEKAVYSLFDRVHAALHFYWRCELSTLRGRKYGTFEGDYSDKRYARVRNHIGRLLKIRRREFKKDAKVEVKKVTRYRIVYNGREGAASGWTG